MARDEAHRRERAAVGAQGEIVAAGNVEHVEGAPIAAYETEHLGDAHSATRPRVHVSSSQDFERQRERRRLEAPPFTTR